MLAVDTNILVRLLTNDDPEQTRRAAAIFQQHEIFIPKTVLLETEWVLRFSYELPRARILAALQHLLGLKQVQMEDTETVIQALAHFEHGMDFADALHLTSSRQCDRFATFDISLNRRAGRRIRLL